MKIDYLKRLALFLSVLLLCLASCKDDDNMSSLGAVTDISWTPTSGGAIITFTAPKSNELLYVKATYTNSLGEEVFNVVSIYDNKIEVNGLADESKEYPIAISAIDKDGKESPVETIKIKPGRSYINIINDNLQIIEIVGGVELRWTNPSGEDNGAGGKAVYVTLNYTDGDGIKTRYLSSAKETTKVKVRGITPGTHKFSFIVEDMMGNKTSESPQIEYNIKEEVTIPKYKDDENGYRTYIWTLVDDQTTLKEKWENTNRAVFDGVIDNKDIKEVITDAFGSYDQSYAGTEKAEYGNSWPWDTDKMDIVIDLHQTINISRIRAWQRAHWYGWSNYAQHWSTDGTSKDYFYYEPENLKSFKVFGSMNTQEWFLIQDCDIATNTDQGPLPVRENRTVYSFEQKADWTTWMPNQASYDAALEGHLWELDTMSPEVRYIRIRFTSNWDSSKGSCSGLSEITLYGGIIEEESN